MSWKLLLISSLLKDKCLMYFDKCFIHIWKWSLFLPSLFCYCGYSDWLFSLKPTLHSWIIMVYYSCYILVESINQFFQGFWFYVHESIGKDKFLFVLSGFKIRYGYKQAGRYSSFSILHKNFCKMNVISSVTAWYYNRINQWTNTIWI